MFNSYLAAIKFMEERDEYNEEDITKVGSYHFVTSPSSDGL